jgi:nucleoside-diphosphate-sugar epimerase
LKKKILLTGYPGWLADNLYVLLSKKYSVYTISKNKININNNYELNFLKKKNLLLKENKFSALIHCAGIIHPSFNSDFLKINYYAPINILKNLKKLKKIIYISSNAVYGKNINDKPQLENYNKPDSSYGKSKYLFEEYLINNYPNNSIILRPASFHSRSFPSKYYKYFEFITKYFCILPKKKVYKNFTNLDLLTDTIIKCLKNKVRAGCYNVCDPKRITLENYHKTVEKCFNKKIIKIYVPNFFFNLCFNLDVILSKLNIYIKNIHLLGEANWSTNLSRKKFTKVFKIKKYASFGQNLKNFIKNDYS